MLKNIIMNILKKFANMGKLSIDKPPNLAMRLFIYLQGNKVYFTPSLGRISFHTSLEKIKGKFPGHKVTELNKIYTYKYLIFGKSKSIKKMMSA